ATAPAAFGCCQVPVGTAITCAALSRSGLPASAAASSQAWTISSIAERAACGSSNRCDTSAAPTRTGNRGSRLMASNRIEEPPGAQEDARPEIPERGCNDEPDGTEAPPGEPL